MMRLMFGLIGLVIAGLLFLSGAHAHAAARVVDGNNRSIFFTKDGKKVNALEANKIAEGGGEVLKCEFQDYECNERTGKCSLKKAK